MFDWYSWLMRWKTRSDCERSTSTSIFGYCSLNALATASATFTSTDAYQTTFPSFSAAATMAGVVSCADAGSANAAATAARIIFLISSSSLLCASANQAPQPLGAHAHPD